MRQLNAGKVFNTNASTQGGSRYIGEVSTHFGHYVELAVVAHHAESGAVEKYASVSPHVKRQNYVKRMLGYYERNVSVTLWIATSRVTTPRLR